MATIGIRIDGSQNYHRDCKEKQWPPGPFPACACPQCRPQSAPPTMMSGALGPQHWSNTEVNWSFSGDHMGDKTCNCSTCNEFRNQGGDAGKDDDDASCGDEESDCIFRHLKPTKKKKAKAAKKKDKVIKCPYCSHVCCHKHSCISFASSKSNRKSPCCGACKSTCSHKCSYSYKHSHASGGGPAPVVGLGGFQDGCIGHYCTGDDKTCWYCRRKKDEEKDEEKAEREKRCHCHIQGGCPEGGLALVGRHHCMTCMECNIDR